MENIFIGILGSLLILDTTLLFQSLVSQPLFSCSLIGLFFGDLQVGLQIGVVLQLLWLSIFPVGGAVVPEGNLAAIVSTVLIFRHHHDQQHFYTVFLFAILYGLLISYTGGRIVVLYRKYNNFILTAIIGKIKAGKTGSMSLFIVNSVLVHVLLMMILISGSLFIGDRLFQYIVFIPGLWNGIFKYAIIAVLGTGAGSLINLYSGNRGSVIMISGVAAGIIYYLGTMP